MPKFRVIETCVYEVEADDAHSAVSSVIDTEGGFIEHFREVSDREVMEINESGDVIRSFDADGFEEEEMEVGECA